MLPRLWIVLAFVLATACSACKPPHGSGGAPSSSAPSAASSAVGPGKIIPVGRFAVDVMEYGQSQRAIDLAKRKNDAIRKDPKWFLEHMKQQKPGEPMTYDPRMGLTAEEFQELQTEGRKTSTHKKADATITITKQGNDVYRIDGGPSLPDLTGIEIDLKNDVVRTPYGVTGKHGDFKMPETTPHGAHAGIRWKYESADASDKAGTSVSLVIGRLEPSGRGILVYYVRKLTPPEEKKRVSVMLYYDLPATP